MDFAEKTWVFRKKTWSFDEQVRSMCGENRVEPRIHGEIQKYWDTQTNDGFHMGMLV